MPGAAANIGRTAKDAKNKAQGAVEQPWVENWTRFGYVVRGVLYVVVGFLAVEVALGRGGETTDKGGALAAIDRQPFGTVLMALTIVGLAGYSLWGFVRAILDPFKRGTDPKGIAQRIGYVISGLSYGALIFPAVSLLMGKGDSSNSGNGGGGKQDLTAAILSNPAGKWLIVLVGIIALCGGLGQLWMAFSADFQKDFNYRDMSQQSLTWARRIGRFGYAARGIVFAIGGFFLAKAGWETNPSETKGLDGALQTLASQPYGPWLLGIVSLGLISFGVYSILCARWIKLKK